MLERAARRHVQGELRRVKDRLDAALRWLQTAWGRGPLSGQLLASHLVPELRGALGQELRRFSAGRMEHWLGIGATVGAEGPNAQHGAGGIAEAHPSYVHDLQSAAGPTTVVHDAETVLGAGALLPSEITRHIGKADVHCQSGRRAMDYAEEELQYPERWKMHNAFRASAQARAYPSSGGPVPCKLADLFEPRRQATTARDVEVHLAHYRRLAATLAELDEEESLGCLREAAVVGLTTTGAAKYQSLVRQLGCKVLVMEEAAEVLEAHVLAALNSSTQQLLLIGAGLYIRERHLALPPSAQQQLLFIGGRWQLRPSRVLSPRALTRREPHTQATTSNSGPRPRATTSHSSTGSTSRSLSAPSTTRCPSCGSARSAACGPRSRASSPRSTPSCATTTPRTAGPPSPA